MHLLLQFSMLGFSLKKQWRKVDLNKHPFSLFQKFLKMNPVTGDEFFQFHSHVTQRAELYQHKGSESSQTNQSRRYNICLKLVLSVTVTGAPIL